MFCGVGEIFYGRPDTPYEGVQAKIEDISIRNVQLSFDRVVQKNDTILAGEVMTKKKFERMFTREKPMF
jgi:hypothetical protein